MDKPELRMGYMSNEELASWFGIAKDTLRKKKKTMLAKLDDFAEFEVVHGGVDILKIYCKSYGVSAYPRVRELLPEYWSLSGLDTSRRVAIKIHNRLSFEGYQYSESTIYQYVCRARSELYGNAKTGEPGPLGRSEHELARYNSLTYEVLPLTAEQWTVVEDVTRATFNVSPPQIIANSLKVLQEDSKRTISKKAVENILTHGNSYMAWKDNLEKALGFKIINATRIYRDMPDEED